LLTIAVSDSVWFLITRDYKLISVPRC